MKYYHRILFTLALAAAPMLRAETLTLQFGARPHASFKGVADTYIRADNPSATNNGSPGLNVGTVAGDGQNGMRALLSFHLAAIPSGAKITNATLRLSVRTPAGRDIMLELRELTRAFAASQASWKNATRDVAWETQGGDSGQVLGTQNIGPSNAAGTWVAFAKSAQLIKAAQAAIDNGGALCLILSAPRQETRSNRAFVSFNSSETQNTGLRPELTVEYAP
jgi:hypothetical protein